MEGLIFRCFSHDPGSGLTSKTANECEEMLAGDPGDAAAFTVFQKPSHHTLVTPCY
jgi:hypothetical protein